MDVVTNYRMYHERAHIEGVELAVGGQIGQRLVLDDKRLSSAPMITTSRDHCKSVVVGMPHRLSL